MGFLPEGRVAKADPAQTSCLTRVQVWEGHSPWLRSLVQSWAGRWNIKWECLGIAVVLKALFASVTSVVDILSCLFPEVCF